MSNFQIKNEEISIIVPGAVIGEKEKSRCAQLTRRVLKSIRKHLPGSEIILSTWQGQNTDGLDYDVLVLTTDPGPNYFITPQGRVPDGNFNRQVIAVQEGLKRATRKYALKTRNDILFTGSGFLNFYGKFPKRCDTWKVLREKVIVSNIYTHHARRDNIDRCFNVSDHFHFGLKEDVQAIWSVEPVHGVPLCFTPEQKIWLTMLSKYGIITASSAYDLNPEHQTIYEISLANNAIVLSHQQIGIKFFKHGYGLAIGKGFHYSHDEWLMLYQKYCDTTLHLHSSFSVKLKDDLATNKVGRSLMRFSQRIETHLSKWINKFSDRLLCIFEK
ncbi:MAG: WavE lipopolysaccharide synthesis family protein [Chloroherpetonaceae bacterium]